MLKKMSRSFDKDQNNKPNAFFTIPNLFVGLKPKGLSESDFVKSPTSPLDFWVFSNLGNPFRALKSSHDGHHKSWDCSKVGLSIIDSLDDEPKLSGHICRSLDCTNILLGSKIWIQASNLGNGFEFLEKPKSLPKNYPISTHTQIKSSNLKKENSDSLFEIGDGNLETDHIGKNRSRSLDSGRCFSSFNRFADRKPDSNFLNPSRFMNNKSPDFDNYTHMKSSENPISVDYGYGFNACSVPLMNNFLSFCHHCKKKLDGEDIFMYRGEKAFCSLICREQVIMNDPEFEEEEAVNDHPENFENNDP